MTGVDAARSPSRGGGASSGPTPAPDAGGSSGGAFNRRLRMGAAPAAMIVLALVGFTVPGSTLSTFDMTMLVNGIVLGIAASGMAFLFGSLGLTTFGIAAYYGGAGYLFAIALGQWHLQIVPAALVALAGTAVFAAAVGALIIRATPLAFTMLTLAIGQSLSELVTVPALESVTSGSNGIVTTPTGSIFGIGGIELTDPTKAWPLVWGAGLLVVVVVYLIRRSRYGRLLEASKQNDERLRFSGYNTYLPRLIAFVVSATIAGLAGVLNTAVTGFASPESLDFTLAGTILVVGFVGGARYALGPLVGGVIYVVVQNQLSSGEMLVLYTGLAIMLVIWFVPQGLLGLAVDCWTRVRPWFGSSVEERGGNA